MTTDGTRTTEATTTEATTPETTATETTAGTDLPTLAVYKLASCDGCQLTLLNCEDELLALAGRVRIGYFPEATRAVLPGPYDLALVEGSVTTAADAERVREIRAASRHLVAIGACATAGGIQALRDFADVAEFRAAVYARPEQIDALARSTPVSAHVRVDFELRGCPVDRGQLLEVVTAFLAGRKPGIPDHSVCFACKRRGTVCVTVARGTPCLGPVTHAGCGALCPAYGRGCYGCFGPAAGAAPDKLIPLLRRDGLDDRAVERFLRTFTAAAFEERRAGGPAGAEEEPAPGDAPRRNENEREEKEGAAS
ncbi:oxidoreductase [Streptomyces sp. F63]|uniref:NADH-quinone oxidoreductase subunit B family protein n=1 Tax=Streptomyces sp. F63 TaxID=2824887 RepID=UPI001B3676A1|nr:oxidoreductase [Streptomyces sp. F63]MBQ0988215.1 oxidoreductase [Streptomyces sp. F63]